MPQQLRWFGQWAPLCAALLLLLPAAAFAQGEVADEAEAEAAGDEAAEEAAPEAELSDEELDEESDEDVEPAAASAEADPEISIYRELKTVEADVNDLKEKVFRSKARLLLLEEKVIRGVVSGAKAVVRHVNNLGPAYELESLTYYFDGNPIYQATNVGSDGELAKARKTEIYEANIPPGNHTLSVTGVIKGRGAGLFAYLSDYSFQFSSSYSFIAADGKTTRLDSVLFKKGGAMADYVEGPTVEFRVRPTKGGAKGGDESDVAESE